jgi:hypothetical protein
MSRPGRSPRRSFIVMLLAAFAAVFLAIPSTLQANDPPRVGSVAGVVLTMRSDRTLVPVSGATVEIMSREFAARTRTNESGGFTFPTLRPGVYQINASKDGVGIGRTRVEVLAGQTARVRVLLQR